MSPSDSVSVFAEGTFQEQLQELFEYTARGIPDEERTALSQSLQDVVQSDSENASLDDDRRRTAFELVLKNTKVVGQGTDQEIEGFFNLLYAHLLTLWQVDSSEMRQHILYLLNVISSSPTNSLHIKYRILSNLFNAVPRSSGLRSPISTALFQIASANGDFEVLALKKSDVEQWLKDWRVSDEEKSQLLNTIIDSLMQVGKIDIAYEYRILLVHTIPSSTPESRSAAIDTILAALRIPTVFDFDTLYNLDPIIAVRDHELFPLIQIFLKNGLPEYRTWVNDHSALLETYRLDSSQLERKIRLLAFSSLALDYIGRDLPYAMIASTLKIDTSEVEKWTIDVIRAGLISGKLSQTSQNLHVYKSSARTFDREQWEALEKRLLAWKAGLASVIEIVAQAQRRGGNVAETVQATQNEQGVVAETTV
ncbi:hypothetical protein JVT61DRAFT_5943 [Boletus reticuloceps]|uniref:Eukaryotic translation initiation factor 3 subunit M n=1 Tax=Boletus reticuloceps TaxID=495285 RepID=A0A8I2YMC6_9AGAM|nr:hypothetical protein JVT61DRAFT_5943 [Boletus reticuloceps]